jgi:peptidoglycan-associated lipoprotein
MSRVIHFFVAAVLVSTASCNRNSNEGWENVKTATRYMQRGVDALWGKDYESRMLTSDEEFLGPYDEDFIPLSDSDLKNSFAATDAALPQPKGVPGQRGIPSLNDFYEAPDALKGLFHSLHYETDDHIVRDRAEIAALMELAGYLKKNPNIFLVVEGHTDERASASYNMALGMRRANYVRSLLVKYGVDLNRIYTLSKGKEQPASLGHNADDWKLNRRSEFKIYQKQ